MKRNLLMAAAFVLMLPAGVSLAQSPPISAINGPQLSPAAKAAADAAAAAKAAADAIAALPNTCGPVVDEPPKPDAAKPDDAASTPSVGQPASSPAPTPLWAMPSSPGASPPVATPSDPQSAASDAKPAVAPAPKLQTKVSRNCADGKLGVEIQGRIFGWKMGDRVQLAVKILVQDGAKINLDPLKRGQMALEDSANKKFELASAPVVDEKDIAGGKEYDLVLEVRNFVPEPMVTFTMQLPYATHFAADGTPMWQLLTSPKFTFNQYMDGVPKMERPMTMGNTGMVQPRKPWAVPASAVVLVLLLLVWPAIELVRFANRVRSRKVMPRDVAAWLAVNRVVKSGKEIGFSHNHYRRIGEVLRKYLSTEYPSLPGLTMSEIEELPADEQTNRIKSVFRKLDRVLFDGARLPAKEHDQLINELDVLVKRPFSI